MLNYDTVLWKGNRGGTGFAPLLIKNNELTLNQNIKVITENNLEFFSSIVKHNDTYGTYIPKNIKSQLTEKKLKIRIEKITGFYAKVTKDGRIYPPEDIIKKYKLEGKEVVKISTENYYKYTHVYERQKLKRKELSFASFIEEKGKTLEFQVHKLKKVKPTNTFLEQLTRDDFEVFEDKEKIVILHGQKQAIEISKKLKPETYAHYLGAFLADGTKRGNNWGICASTQEQATYYLDCHKQIILAPELSYSVVYTTYGETEPEEILNKWKKLVKEVNTIAIIKAKSTKKAIKYNKDGTLVIKENKKLTQLVYNELVKVLVEKIVKEKNKKLAQEFILGILEGDGNVAAAPYGGLIITSNKLEVKTIEAILKQSKFEFSIYREGENKYTIRIGSISVLNELPNIHALLFKYYPKRRKKFIERFSETGAARCILGKNDKLRGDTKTNLVKKSILNANYTLTKKGKQIKRILQKMISELN